MKWSAYAHRGESVAWNIWVVSAVDPDASGVNLTKLYAHHSLPAWSPDGKYLFFQSDRDGSGLYALPLKPESIRIADTDLKFEKSTNAVKVEIDLEDTSRRIRKVAAQSPQSDLTITPEGLILFLSDGDIWSVDYAGKETKRLTSGGGKSNLRLFKDGKRISYVSNGELTTMKLDDKGQEKVSFTADCESDVRAERQA